MGMETLLSMAVAVVVYTTLYGWRFAIGLVLSIYVHEMGHVVWLRRYGIPASAPYRMPSNVQSVVHVNMLVFA